MGKKIREKPTTHYAYKEVKGVAEQVRQIREGDSSVRLDIFLVVLEYERCLISSSADLYGWLS